MYHCKPCHNARCRATRLNPGTKEYERRYDIEYRAKHKEELLAAYIKRAYNLTTEQVASLRASQNNSCAICHTSFVETKPCFDHDHESGKVRGMLCNHCNTALGLLKDDPNIIRNAVSYLEQNVKENISNG